MTRSVLFDTETTGLEPLQGHRVIEIAALELLNDIPTGRHFHVLVDPERDIPEDASRVHGFTAEDLIGKPRFADVVDDLLAFFKDATLIAHNAPFDFAFLNAELALLSRPSLEPGRMLDTLAMAKARFPGMPNSLDAICRRFSIDLSARIKHNALLDCRLLARAYIELTGGRQRGLTFSSNLTPTSIPIYVLDGPREPRFVIPSEEERAANAALVSQLYQPLWLAD